MAASYLEDFLALLSGGGGDGDDTVVATVHASISENPTANIRLEGGSGLDHLRSAAELRP